MVEILARRGYEVTLYARRGGYFNVEPSKWGVRVILDENMFIGVTLDDLNKYDLVIVNTMWLYNVINNEKINKPIIWWLHDSEMIYEGVNNRAFRKAKFGDNLKPYAVGEVARKAFFAPSAKL